MSEKIILGSNGIKRVLRKFSPVEAIAEYIWNGYDADATKIDVQIDANAIEGINKITIIDNGCGIDFRSLDKKFKPFYESNKMLYKNENNNSSLIHGKNGIGRLTFFTNSIISLTKTSSFISSNSTTVPVLPSCNSLGSLAA